jgi:hypothetical protein
MKKLMLFATVIILFASCEEPTTALQYGVVEKNELCDSYGYKYKVTVKNIAKQGINNNHYILLTNENYHIGDTIKIK